MGLFHWSRPVGNHVFFESRDQCLQGRLGSVVLSCLIFLQPLLTLVTDPDFIHLATGLSVNFTACQLHFPACRLIEQACLYQVSSLSQIWNSRLYVMTVQEMLQYSQ